MISFFKGNKYSNYRDIILRAFPRTLKKDVELVLNILPFSVTDIKLEYGGTNKVEILIAPDHEIVLLDGERLEIPNRLYINEPDLKQENKLTPTQKNILNCIYLRHHNGYIRQRRLEKINSNEYWITPFVFHLLGDYVFEILEAFDKQIDNNKLDTYKRFAIENPIYYQKTESRMISYWGEYYRSRALKLNFYIGKSIFDQISLKRIGKDQDEIIEIGIDDKGRLFLKPKNESFSLIYRSASEIHWDNTGRFLYTPKPREWDYYDWYRHLTDVINTECNCKLFLTRRTTWTNIPKDLKTQIFKSQTMDLKS